MVDSHTLVQETFVHLFFKFFVFSRRNLGGFHACFECVEALISTQLNRDCVGCNFIQQLNKAGHYLLLASYWA